MPDYTLQPGPRMSLACEVTPAGTSCKLETTTGTTPPPPQPFVGDALTLTPPSQPACGPQSTPIASRAFIQEIRWFKSTPTRSAQQYEARLQEFSDRLVRTFNAKDVCSGDFRYSAGALQAAKMTAADMQSHANWLDRQLYTRVIQAAAAAEAQRK